MNVPAVLQNIRSKHPVAYVVLYLFVVWVLLVIITHAIAFGAELLIASSDQPVVKWETTDECTDGTRTIYYNSPSLYQEFKVKIKDSKIVDAELGSLFRVCKISGWKLVNSWLGNYGNAHRIPTTNLTNSIC